MNNNTDSCTRLISHWNMKEKKKRTRNNCIEQRNVMATGDERTMSSVANKKKKKRFHVFVCMYLFVLHVASAVCCSVLYWHRVQLDGMFGVEIIIAIKWTKRIFTCVMFCSASVLHNSIKYCRALVALVLSPEHSCMTTMTILILRCNHVIIMYVIIEIAFNKMPLDSTSHYYRQLPPENLNSYAIRYRCQFAHKMENVFAGIHGDESRIFNHWNRI